jgi:formate/nitrite transporter
MQSLILSPPLIYEAVDKAAFTKTHLHKSKVMALAFMSGCYVAMSAQALMATLAGSTPSGPLLVLGTAVFTWGLVCMVSLGGELFTGNGMILMGVLNGHVTLREMLEEWGLCYLGNVAGTFSFSVLIYCTGVNGYQTFESGPLTTTGLKICSVVNAKANLRPHEMFCRGILCNICVCCAVLLSFGSTSQVGKIFAMWLSLTIFVVSQYEHCVANMYFFSQGTLLNCNEGKDHGYYWLVLLLSTLGNIVGASFLTTIYWFSYCRPDPNVEGDTHKMLVPVRPMNAPSTVQSFVARKNEVLDAVLGQPTTGQPTSVNEPTTN